MTDLISRYTKPKRLVGPQPMKHSSQIVEAPVPGFWSSLREAVVGTRQDFTEGSMGRAIILLAVPMVLEMCMESLFGVVDVFWVAHLGADATAKGGLSETALTLRFAAVR